MEKWKMEKWKIDNLGVQSEFSAQIKMGPATSDEFWGHIIITGPKAKERRDFILKACNQPDRLQAELAASQSHETQWRKESSNICDALADLANLPRDPRPGWVNCIDKIEADRDVLLEALRDGIMDGRLQSFGDHERWRIQARAAIAQTEKQEEKNKE